jgi:hypothetical protein
LFLGFLIKGTTMLLWLSKSIRRNTKPRTFMLAISVFCLSNVGLIVLHKQLTSQGSTDDEKKDLIALDYRKEGYNAADVESLLRCAEYCLLPVMVVLLLLLLLLAASEVKAVD